MLFIGLFCLFASVSVMLFKRTSTDMEKLMKQCPVHYISAINRVPVDTNVDTLGDFKEWFEQCLKQYDFDKIPLVGGVDYSWNYENGQNYICQHFHFLAVVFDRKPLIECLRKSFFVIVLSAGLSILRYCEIIPT